LYIRASRSHQVFRMKYIAVFIWSFFTCEPSRCTKRNTFRAAECVHIFCMQSVQMNFPWKCCLPDWQTRYLSVYHTRSFNYPVFLLASALIILEKDFSTNDSNKNLINYVANKCTVSNVWRSVFLVFHYLR